MIANHFAGKSLLRHCLVQGIVVIIGILPVVVHLEVNFRSVKENRIGNILIDNSINIDLRLVRIVAEDNGAMYGLDKGVALRDSRRPHGSRLLTLSYAISKDVADRDGIGCGQYSIVVLILTVVGRGGVVYRGGVGERGRGDIRRQVIRRSSVSRRSGVRSRGLFRGGLRGDDDRLAYRLGLGDNGGGLRSLRRSGDGRFVRDLHRDGVRVLHDLARGETAAEIRRAAVQQVRHERVADVQLHAVRAGDVRPDVAADLDLPLVDAGAGGGDCGELELIILCKIILCKLDRMRNKPVRAVDKEILVRSGGGDEGGGHEAEGKRAAEKQR